MRQLLIGSGICLNLRKSLFCTDDFAMAHLKPKRCRGLKGVGHADKDEFVDMGRTNEDRLIFPFLIIKFVCLFLK